MALVSNPFLDRHPAMSPPPTTMGRPPPALATRAPPGAAPRTPSPMHLQDQAEEAMRTYEHEFHAGLRQVRDAYAKLVASRDADVLNLRTELARKDAENKELAMRITQLEEQLGKADKRVEVLTRTVTKLHQFRQQVFESFVDDDSILSDAVMSGTMLGRRVSIGLGGAGNASAMSDRRLSGLLQPDTTMDRTTQYVHDSPTYPPIAPYTSSTATTPSRPPAVSTSSHRPGSNGGSAARTAPAPPARRQSLGTAPPPPPLQPRTQQPPPPPSRATVPHADPEVLDHAHDLDDHHHTGDLARHLQPDPDLGSNSSTASASPIDDYAFPDSESPNGDEFETVSPTPAARNVGSRVSPPPPPPVVGPGPRARDAGSDPAVLPRSANGSGFAPLPAPAPPTRSRTASSTGEPHTVDARDFFRVARRTLSYDEFTALLHHVKAFNARHQSRSDTLHHLYELLTPRHVDLYAQFERILSGARRAPGTTRGGSVGGSSGSDA
ncbi:hypothetical protein AMAG_17012 [Allomyces macrogynus ATCC 38327]|uniref:At4g15545-like C-terminal domain-containing protein n=1 Tax=Allomyces macrogynus (strain ATCC 38327) TaxID=578462 RepID=A0A0L0TD19_ALLM3|nr:hypothetical protein AMAG_17012 [Allomyces macrogynus ATCC 38327]|eukprot:KNE72570.1 hypothetical protein AMAG_17012 [Allomyces macrogynus ATCC 38327]